MKNRNKIKLDPGTRALRIISYVFVSIWALICLLPFILVISASFSTESVVAKEGFGLLPKRFTLSAYELVFRSPKMILGSYGVTIALTVCGTVVGLVMHYKERIFRFEMHCRFLFTLQHCFPPVWHQPISGFPDT